MTVVCTVESTRMTVEYIHTVVLYIFQANILEEGYSYRKYNYRKHFEVLGLT